MTAALLSGFVLMFAVPDGIGGLLVKWYGFPSLEACQAEAPRILTQPINAGALVVSDCEPGQYLPGGRGDVHLGGHET